jgi:glycerol uptake facilitator-like aquaporin
VTDERLYFSKENAINCFIIASAYCAAREIVNGVNVSSNYMVAVSSMGACLNPAIAVGVTLASIIVNPGESLKWFWLYWGCPMIGSVVCIIFYRFIYLKTQLMIS